MELVINVDALDKTASAVDAASTRVALDSIQQLTLGNSEPLTLSFCDDDGAAPSWVTDSSTGLAVGLGAPDVDGSKLYTSTTAFLISGSSRIGTLNLNTTALRNAIYEGVGCGRAGVMMVLEIRKVASDGGVQTLGLLNVWVANRILTLSPSENSVPAPFGIIPLPSISALTGGSASCLDGVDDTYLPTGYTALLSYGRIPQIWQIFAGTDATDVTATPAIVRVKNYGASNNRVWVQLM